MSGLEGFVVSSLYCKEAIMCTCEAEASVTNKGIFAPLSSKVSESMDEDRGRGRE